MSYILHATGWLTGLVLCMVGGQVGGQTMTNEVPASATNAPAASATEPAHEGWSFGASVYGYIVHESRDYLQPTITADRGWLHLEARYNYEAFDTASVWVGYNFAGGEKLAWEITPMLGGVFGDTTGIAPGYKGSLSWWKLELYSEGEYLFNTRHSSESFFYNWSELSLAPLDWFHFGLVSQLTRLYQTDREIQRGFLVGVSWKKVHLTTYVFNPDESHPVFVIAGGIGF
jgi:hypothetical protein